MLLRTNVGCIIALCVFVATCIYSYSKRTAVAKNLARAILASTIVLLCYIININIPDDRVKTVCVTLEYISVLWVIFFMTIYASYLCDKQYSPKIIKVAAAVLLVDSAVIASAPINQYAGQVTIQVFDNISVAIFNMKPLFWVHILIMLLLYGFQSWIIISTIKVRSFYYSLRYVLLLVAFFLIGCPNMIVMFYAGKQFDTSRWIYSVGTVLVFYITFLFSPKNLFRRLRDYVDDSIADATIIYDCDGNVLQINKSARNLFEREVWDCQSRLEAKIGSFDDSFDKRIEIGDRIYNLECTKLFDKRNLYVATTLVFHDVTEVEKRFEMEHHIAVTDPLTKSYNRVGFFEAVRGFMKKGDDKSGYVLVISGICNFKGINSLYGVKAGDEVLKVIASKLHEFHHKYDFLYGRTSEGKFASLVPLICIEEIVAQLSHIIIDLGDGIEVHAELNHGYVKLDDEVKSLDYYYELALLALSKAKESARITAIEYSEDMEDVQHKQQMLLGEMRIAIEEGEFFIELQPQLSLDNKKIVGAEALVRWNHPSLGRIPPNDFIPLFEENGYITFLDHFVWEEAAKTIRKFLDEDSFTGSISVNVSRMDIMNTDVPTVFEMLAMKYDIPPSKLHVEITESACVDSPDALINAMTELREKGFMVEIDDFGSGYSSLNALMKLPFDIVKLDMAFMKQTEMNEKSDVVISSIAKMIHNLHASIIVEGVETEGNVMNAINYGADVAQGYFFSRPVSKEKFLELVKMYNY